MWNGPTEAVCRRRLRWLRRLAVIGLGYAGLPLVQAASAVGFNVVGFDSNPTVADGLSAGKSHVVGVDDEAVARMVRGGVKFGSSEDILNDCDIVAICVPTPLLADGAPDLSHLVAAGESVARCLRRGELVIVESTSYPGTTDEVVRGILEGTGLEAGVDFNLASSPERIDPGNLEFSLRNTPKVVGGLAEVCTRRAAAFYGRFCERVVPAKGPREAEMAKLIENTYRHVNIALVNEMAMFARGLGVDIHDALDCAASKPFGFQEFRPGPGAGGHCIPVDPCYLAERVRDLGAQFNLAEAATDVNNRMPGYVVERIREMLVADGKTVEDATVVLLGVTYKENISDIRNSPAVHIAELLYAQGVRVRYHDPTVATWSVNGQFVHRVEDDLSSGLVGVDIVVLLQAHRCYTDEALSVAPVVLDTRRVLSKATEYL
ncbi:nucleotide sugar dehydrogenase [Parenemella sanctibonifatiensis]|uniref:UDP-N-acetyl-D-glucosamine dehydrogenase n=1 Tax=Parenemella sanctibonifatiensis TaxID=2016505 RepID=A0A255EA00_9ACTN|nr:nucleotide sugar dehydrogenase [Parenemella sanctibonifatiensis]OYN88379.1 UDP-N-acetyl-D-glucosamine dehydrogenase [Parenemella sanctibonifatiensis]